MNIQNAYLSINQYSRPGIKRQATKKIIIHWVGNAGSSAMGNRNYFESLKYKKTYASSQFIIGLNGEIIACMPEDEVAYHAINYNLNSIGIENCHPDWGGKFNDKTYSSLIELLTYLCKKYGLNQNDIIRHYDATGKVCPKYYVEHQDAFEQLKADVANKLGNNYTKQVVNVPPTTSNSYDTYRVCYNGTNIRRGPSLNSAVAYQKNSGEEVHVVGSENGFYKLDDGNYIRMGYAYKTSSAAVQSGSNYRVLYNGTNIRKGSGLGYGVAYQKNSGDIVTVVGTENDFYKLSDGNYLRIGYAEKTSGGNTQSSNNGAERYRVNSEYPNIRAKSNLNSRVVRLAKKGEIINVVGKENGFLRLSDGTYLKEGFADKI
jgi:N-acetylmuramoyl-L-alanine amidase